MTSQAEAARPTEGETIVDQFAVVEIFGHRRLAGRVKEVEQFGTKMLRIDIPTEGDFAKGFTTQLYGGGSLFSVTPCTLEYVDPISGRRCWRHEMMMTPAAAAMSLSKTTWRSSPCTPSPSGNHGRPS